MKDIARIHRAGVVLELKQIEKELPAKYDLKWFESVWNKMDYKIKTCERDGKVVGFYTKLDGEVMIYVDPEYHRQGIGSELLCDNEVWVIGGNLIAEGFYEKHGFKRSGKIRRQNMFGHDIWENQWTRRGNA